MLGHDQESDTRRLLEWLVGRDVPCPLCRYNLRDLTRPVCPECGKELRLSVSLAEPYLKAWVALLVALLLPAGLGLLWIVIIAKSGPPDGPESAAIFPIVYQVVAIPLSICGLAGRARILRWERSRQLWTAAAGWVLCVVSFVWLLAIIR